ncbi:MAG: ABC transporter ATP-binding protein [Bacilli bacterium]|nr:ABC transporter ATP-binding protein [Bacilli bacterium]
MHNRTIEKDINFKENISKLFNYIKKYLYLIIPAVILAFICSVISIIGPDKLKDMTDTITEGIMTGIDLNKVKSIGIFLIIIYVIGAVFGYIQGFIMSTVTNRCAKGLRSEIGEKINRLPLRYFDKTAFGDVLSRVTNDVDTIAMTLNQTITTLVTSSTLFIGSLFMMFKTNYIMAITAILSSLIGFAFMGLILSKSQKYFNEQQEQLGNLNGHIEEIYAGQTVVKLYNAMDDASNKFDSINEKLYVSNRKSQFLSGLMPPLMGFIGNFGYVAVCVVGSILVINGNITFGVIVAFMIYIRLFSNPLSQIAQVFSTLQSAAAASGRVFAFLGEEEMSKEDVKKVLNKDKIKGDIEFNNISFGYDDDKLVIKKFSAYAKAGSKIAIVGPTGAGKTTMVNLLMKFYDIKDGDILIDGISIKELSRENIHDLFTMVLQDTWVFTGTINDNVKYNNKKISDSDVEKACKAVGLDHFIKTLSKGYNTELNETESLSSGQKQLLTIARAYLSDKPFLILDEATSSVDTRTEELVQKAMDKLTKGRTSFIIAHRLSTIKNADLILVMKEGNIVEQGNHEELLKKKGFYAELYNSQFETLE